MLSAQDWDRFGFETKPGLVALYFWQYTPFFPQRHKYKCWRVQKKIVIAMDWHPTGKGGERKEIILS